MPFDYTKYNYEELVEEATRLIKQKDEWKDAYQSSTGQVLIQLIAAMTDQLHYMLERRSQENFMPTAKLKTSVNAIANMLGYRPTRVISSSGQLNITLTDEDGNPVQSDGNVVIPKYSTITYEDKLFVNKEELTFLPSQTYPAVFDVIEGELETLTFDPTDTSTTLYQNNYIVIEDYDDIEENSIEVYTPTQTFYDVRDSVGGNPPLESLSLADSTDEAYDIRLTNDGLRIIFGDGVYGAKPTGTLTIRYIRSNGPNVEVQSTGLDFSFESETVEDDSVPTNEYSYILQNTTTIDGGQKAETAEQTKQFAPDYVRTAARAVTKHDYRFWALESNVGGIVDAKAYGEEEKGITVFNMNNVYMVYLTDDGSEFTTAEQQSFRDYLDIYKNLTTHLVLIQAEVVPLQINMEVKRSSVLSASNSEIYDFLKNDLIEYFKFRNGSLGTDVYHSELVDRYHNITMTKNGIQRRIADYIKMDIKALKSFSTPLSTQNTDVTITYGSDGDLYRLTVNGTDYDYTAQVGDDANAVATALAALVDADADVSASASTNTITVATVTSGTPFTITNEGSTTPLNNRIDITVQLPVSLLNNEDNEQLFLPNSIEIIQTDGTVIDTDDGSGNIYNGTVDYQTGEVVIPILSSDDYYIRYQQDDLQNYVANSEQAISYSEPKANYSDSTELLSTITLK